MQIKDSDKIALINDDKKISYHTLLQKVYLFSFAFEVQKDDRVIIFSEPRVGYVYALFSIWSKGATYSQCFYNVDAKTIAEHINIINPKAIFVSTAKYNLLKDALKYVQFEVNILLIDELEKIPVAKHTPIANLHFEPNAIAFRVFTAGIVNKHKPIELTFANVKHTLNNLIKKGFYKKDDKVLVLLPFYNNWILLSTVFFPLLCGLICVFATKDDIHSVIKTISKHKVSVLILVKRIYDGLLEVIFNEKLFWGKKSIIYKLASKINNRIFSKIMFRSIHKLFGKKVRYFLTIGAKLEKEIYEPLLTLGFEVFEGYGMAETSSLVTYPASKRTHPESVGKIIDELKYKIINDELILSGPNIGKKYYNKQDLNEEYFNNEWFFTKDIVEIDAEGYMQLIGRFNDKIVLKTGRIIVPDELEKILNIRTDYITESGIYYHDDMLKAVIVPTRAMIEKYGRENNYLILQSIIRWKVVEYYNHTVPQYKRINKIVITEKRLDRSTSGKIKRYLLYEYEKEKDFVGLE